MAFKFGLAIAAIATITLAPIAASAHNTGFQQPSRWRAHRRIDRWARK